VKAQIFAGFCLIFIGYLIGMAHGEIRGRDKTLERHGAEWKAVLSRSASDSFNKFRESCVQRGGRARVDIDGNLDCMPIEPIDLYSSAGRSGR
jgi:hypothetical protein